MTSKRLTEDEQNEEEILETCANALINLSKKYAKNNNTCPMYEYEKLQRKFSSLLRKGLKIYPFQ